MALESGSLAVDVSTEYTTVQNGDLYFIERGGVPGKITGSNLEAGVTDSVTTGSIGAQPVNANLTSISALGTAFTFPYTTAQDTWAEAPAGAFGVALVAMADQAAALAALGLTLSLNTPTRALGVTYTNTDPFVRFVHVSGFDTSNSPRQTRLQGTIGNPAVVTIYGDHNSQFNDAAYASLTMAVPPGEEYAVNLVTGQAQTLVWTETGA